MKKALSKFSFPYTKQILIFSAIMIFLPIILLNVLDRKYLIDTQHNLSRMIILLPTLFATLGFIYCVLSYHFRTIRGDELKLRIHLEALNIAFTTTLISLFLLIFIFINFNPRMLNWILVILAIITIITYLLASAMVKEKYQ